MLINEFVNKVYLLATGDTEAYNPNDEEYQKALMIADIEQDTWAREEKWQSSIKEFELLISQDIRDYDLEDNFLGLCPTPMLDKGVDYQIIGNKIRFSQNFVKSNDQRLIKFDYYALPEKVSTSQEIAVDNPDYLVFAVAAEICRTDSYMSYQYGNLVGKAQELMRQMKNQNRRQSSSVPRKIRRVCNVDVRLNNV